MTNFAATYRRLLSKHRRVALERAVPNGSPKRLERVRARISGAAPEELAGGVLAADRTALVLAEDIPPEWRPLKKNDAILVDGLRLTFKERPDDQTHRDGESLLAYVGRVSGA